MSNDKMREAFEEAWLSEFPQANMARAYSGEGYEENEVDAGWDGYRMALTQQPESEPAAEVFERVGENGSYEEVVFYYDCPPGTKLYKSPQAPAQVPDGWQAAAKVALEFACCPGATNYPQNCIAHIEGLAKLILSAAPSIAEKREGEQ